MFSNCWQKTLSVAKEGTVSYICSLRGISGHHLVSKKGITLRISEVGKLTYLCSPGGR